MSTEAVPMKAETPEDTQWMPAIPPVIDPARWEDFEAFRETFLANFTVRKHNTALRATGDLLRSLIFEAEALSRPSGSGLHHQLRAVVGDLRFLQAADVLMRFAEGRATREENRQVVRHLVRRCPACAEQVRTQTREPVGRGVHPIPEER